MSTGMGRARLSVAALLVLLVAVPATAQPSFTPPPGIIPVPADDVLALTPEMRAWAHAEVPASLPPTERLDLLVRRLQDTDGGALVYDPWFTVGARESFAAQRFNCLSFSHLLVAMARELGLEVYYLEARYRERYDREGDLVLLSGHVTVGWGGGIRHWVVEFGQQSRLDTSRVVRIDDRRALALHHANLGAAALRRGDPRTALGQLATAIAVDPRAGGAWVNLGVALRRRGDLAGAENAYRQAIAVEADLLPGYSNLYSLLRATHRSTAALVADIAQLRNRDPWLLLAMGDECMEAHDLGCAERLFRQARAAAPDEAAPAAALAALALSRGDAEKARRWLRRAEQRDPSEPRLVGLRAALGLPPHRAPGDRSSPPPPSIPPPG
jgi:Flp pilus assembly protein TadD